MTAPTVRTQDTQHLNRLRRGTTYRATTRDGTAVGEYLGMETPHGDRAILLRHGTATESIPISAITSIYPAAA